MHRTRNEVWAKILIQFDDLGVGISDWTESVGGTLNSFFRMAQSLSDGLSRLGILSYYFQKRISKLLEKGLAE